MVPRHAAVGWISSSGGRRTVGPRALARQSAEPALAFGSRRRGRPVSSQVSPASGTRVVNFSNAVVVLEGGNLLSALTNTIGLSDRSKVIVDAPNPQRLSLTLTAGNGSFQGRFVHPKTGKSTPLKGVLLQKQNLGAGFSLAPTNAGACSSERSA